MLEKRLILLLLVFLTLPLLAAALNELKVSLPDDLFDGEEFTVSVEDSGGNAVEGATAINTNATSTESIRRSAILYTPGSTALTGTGAVSSSRVDTGSASSIGTLSAGSTKTATLRVTAVSGSGTATIKIQDSSSSGSGYGDFLAFAQISGVGVQSVQTTDACERYLQINVTQYSGLTNFNCMVSMGVEVGTY